MPSLRTHLSFAAIALFFLAACDRDIDRVVGPTTPVVSPVHRTSSLSPDEIRTILGPKLFVRSTGAPVTDTVSIAGYASDATLRIVNGDALGNYRATSGTVLVDGQEVVHPSAFGEHVGSISVPITLRNTSVIGVRLAGSPGDQVTMSIEGHLATTATVTGAGGTIHLLGTQVTLTFPVGAVSGSVVVTSVPAPAPSSEAAPGTTVDLGPSGTVFSSPVTLSIAFDPTTLPRGARPASLRMHWWNTDHWEKLPGNSVDLQRGVVSAQVTHFTTFALLPNEVEFCTSDPTAESDLQTAISHVPAGGTVYVCDGRHVVNDVTIDRPLMLAAEHAGMATLVQPDTATTLTPVLRINGVADGTVSIVNMNVEFRRIGLLAMALYDQIVVTGTTFTGAGVSAGTGVQLIETSVPTAKVTFDHDTFTNSYVGLNQFQPVDIDVFHSDFHDLRNYALLIFTANGTQNPSPTGTPIMRTARVQWNTFTNCGRAGCIALQQAGRDTVRFNQISMPSGNVSNGIFLYRDGQPADLIAPNVITDNTISGHGPTGDSTVSANWGVTRALSSRQGPAPTIAPGVADIFERNTINGAFVGLSVLGPIMMVATDNRVANTYAAINYGGTDPVKAHRNDFVGYHYPIAQSMASIPLNAQPANAVPGSLTCNYWGSPSGPIGVFPGVPLASYTRYSAVPIAGNPSVTCDPTTIPPTVRACAAPSSDGMLTKPTVLEAYNAVPSGGTVLVCDGTFVVSNLTISKPVTITAEGPGMPTLDAGGGAKVFGIQNVLSGAVTISKLKFTGGTSGQVTVNNNVATANITENEFHPPQTQPYPVEPLGYLFGLQVSGSGIGTVNIDHNAFIDGDLGITVGWDAATQLNITQNTFASQVTSAVTMSGRTATAYNYTIERNSFEDCLNPCIFTKIPVRVVNNTFTVHIGRPSRGPMISLYVQDGNLNPSTVTDNTIIGMGNNATARTDSATYPVRGPAIIAYAGVADVSRNRITNTFLGIGSWNGATVTASDNVIQTTFAPLTGWGGTATSLTANWNDFSDYLTAVEHAGPLNLGALNIRCNWWGQATGPTSIYPAVPMEVYTPFALAPVAGQTHAGCTP